MNIQDFKAFRLKIENALLLNDSNIQEKSINLSNFYNDILSIYVKELKVLKNLKLEMEKLYGTLYHKYKYNFEFQLDSKAEIDTYVKSDDDYYKMALKYVNQEVQVKFLEQTLDNINNLGFRIKNYIDIVKIKKGLI